MPKTNSDGVSEELSEFLVYVRELEIKRKSRIWCVIHPGQWHICGPMMFSLIQQREEVRQGDLLEILLHSPGGHPDIAYAAMKFFRKRFKQVNVIVPISAKSAATLMCLGADKVFMGELADLGPIDVQINDQVQHGAKSFSPLDEFKSIEFLKEQAVQWMDYHATIMNRRYGIGLKEALADSIPLVTGMMRPLFDKIDPLEMGGHRRALAIGEQYAKRVLTLTRHYEQDEVDRIVRKLVWDYPSHDFRIDHEEAASIGLPVSLLPEDQDKGLVSRLLNLDKDDAHHGFPPIKLQATIEQQNAGAQVAVRGKPKRRVNGSAAAH